MPSLTPPRDATDPAFVDDAGLSPDAASDRHPWRALEEAFDDPQLRQRFAEAWPQGVAAAAMLDRRSFLKLLGASMALAGLGACSRPPAEQIVPRVVQPEGMPLALPQFYATTLRCCGNVAGALVETHAGRPTKIEGNPLHPTSLGASNASMQAAVLDLWDPDRSKAVLRRGLRSDWKSFLAEAKSIARQFDSDGSGLHVLSGALDSPTLAVQRTAFLRRFPGAQWHTYEDVGEDNVLEGARLAFGQPLRTRWSIDRADVIVALEADFLGSLPGHLRHASDFASRRKPAAANPTMNRLYAIESTPTLTGAKADHRWRAEAARVEAFVVELAIALGIDAMRPGYSSAIPMRQLQAIADDLRQHRGASLVLAGPTLSPTAHDLVHRINRELGNVGATLDHFDPPESPGNHADSLRTLMAAMADGQVDTLVILDGNPAYAMAADLRFGERLHQVPRSIHLGLYDDETAALCHWHLPAAHALESWSDLRACDGTVGIVQPVIAPLYGGRSAHELIALLMGDATSARDRLRDTWKNQLPDDTAWERALRDGAIIGSVPAMRDVSSLQPVTTSAPARITDAGLELLFRPDPTVWDGRHASNAWLQELPKPLSLLTWSNAALISPALALARGLRNGDVVSLRVAERQIEAPVWIMPGQADRSVTFTLGYGRRRAGQAGTGLGYDAHALRSSASPWRLEGLTIATTGRHVELATTQRHHSMEARAPVRSGTLAQFLADPAFAQDTTSPKASLYPERKPGEYAWGMSIDLNACIGCNVCTIACQAENNIPVVGADQVRRGREMHWIRVDRYYEGTPESARTLHQPVPCMHCEHAPCEVVCPVGATVHDSEGLNLQVYNRCVGTRFCANNCPYKVRRFNFLQYADLHTEQLKAQRNPDVTVRNRGVMEKCTYCIQRIETAHIAADRDGRRLHDGEIVTACQAACPTRAITFGDIADPASAVSLEKASPRNYTLLDELNTRPRTTYLAALRNPNPALGDDP